MSAPDVNFFLEFYTYMLLLKRNERRAALSLDFKPEDSIHSFCTKLKVKLKESELSPRHAVAPVAATRPAKDGNDPKDITA